MKKSSFVALMLGTIAGVFFAFGMCMALLPEWNAFRSGILFGSIGILMGAFTVFLWRKMEGKAPIKINPRFLGLVLFGIGGALILGIGMCFCMVWNHIVLGSMIGLIGILLLLLLIPITKGIR